MKKQLIFFSQVESDSFVLSPLPCPAGYRLSPISPNQRDSMQHCTCLESAEVITCEDDQDNVIIRVSNLNHSNNK